MALLQWHDSNSCMTKRCNLESSPNQHIYKSQSASSPQQIMAFGKIAAFQHKQNLIGRTESWKDLWHLNQLLWSEELSWEHVSESKGSVHNGVRSTGSEQATTLEHACLSERVPRSDMSQKDLGLIFPICKTKQPRHVVRQGIAWAKDCVLSLHILAGRDRPARRCFLTSNIWNTSIGQSESRYSGLI